MTPPNVEDAFYQADYFSAKDAQALNTLLTDFSVFILGGQGKEAGISEEDKQFVRSSIGGIKALANKLAHHHEQ